MSRLQKVESWIPDFTLGKPLQKLLAVFCNKLGGQFDCLVVDVSKFWVLDRKLICRRCLYNSLGLRLQLGITKELFSEHALIVFLVLIFIIQGSFFLLLFLSRFLALVQLLEIVRAVRVVFIL